ncbi:hypothetical protein [Nostoc sp. WHI]|uniref:hypothetical protein n=1 Tax=Nostoc sp. WHI TaxID=2650611 RepID=UPI0018C491A7|nr:hypothetical protein [Nostoc sp. WHI]MBG1267620.1 hypothetical protein [Nostoc sp. WHI]
MKVTVTQTKPAYPSGEIHTARTLFKISGTGYLLSERLSKLLIPDMFFITIPGRFRLYGSTNALQLAGVQFVLGL